MQGNGGKVWWSLPLNCEIRKRKQKNRELAVPNIRLISRKDQEKQI